MIERVQAPLIQGGQEVMAWVTATTGGVIRRVNPLSPVSPVPPASPRPQAPKPERVDPATQGLPHTPNSFAAAKKALYEKVYYDHRVTFYCGCQYTAQKEVALDTCGLQSLSGISRAKRIEAEHVFPAAQFGNFRKNFKVRLGSGINGD